MENMMYYKNYRAEVQFDEEDGIWFGSVIGIDDMLGFHGFSCKEAEANFHNCVESYLSLCASRGEAPETECLAQTDNMPFNYDAVKNTVSQLVSLAFDIPSAETRTRYVTQAVSFAM